MYHCNGSRVCPGIIRVTCINLLDQIFIRHKGAETPERILSYNNGVDTQQLYTSLNERNEGFIYLRNRIVWLRLLGECFRKCDS